MLETAEVMEDMEDQEEVTVAMAEDMVGQEVMEALEGLEEQLEATLTFMIPGFMALPSQGKSQSRRDSSRKRRQIKTPSNTTVSQEGLFGARR